MNSPLDILIGDSHQPKNNFGKLERQKPKFSIDASNDFKILVISWNMMGKLPNNKALEILLPPQRTRADMIVIGTQQCQTSLFVSFFCKNKNCWEKMVCQYMAQRNFQVVETQKLQGLHIICFVKSNKLKYISSLKSERVKTGFYGFMGNKGAVSLNIKIGNQPYLFIDMHLPSSHNQNIDRNDHLIQIIDKLIDKQKKQNIVLFGDMNYRLNVTGQQSRSICALNEDKSLLYNMFQQKDQLTQQKELQFFLKLFNQETINFPPTYKLSVDDNTYDHNRITGWTDRIFYYGGGLTKFRQDQYYSDMYVLGSDHRPVFGLFTTKLDLHEGNLQNSKERNKKKRKCLFF